MTYICETKTVLGESMFVSMSRNGCTQSFVWIRLGDGRVGGGGCVCCVREHETFVLQGGRDNKHDTRQNE